MKTERRDNTPSLRQCPFCGERLWAQDRFCPNCGASVIGQQEIANGGVAGPDGGPTAAEPDSTKKRKGFWRRKP